MCSQQSVITTYTVTALLERVGDTLSWKPSLDKPSPWMRPMLSPRIFPLSLLMRGHLFILAKLHLLYFPFQCYRSVISYAGAWVQTKSFLPLKEQGSLEHKPRRLELESHKSGASDSTHAVWPPSVTGGISLFGFLLPGSFYILPSWSRKSPQ